MEKEQRPDKRNSDRSQSAARALSVLDLLEHESQGLGVREMARRLKLAPSIVQRLLAALADYGYVERNLDTQSYRIGFRLFEVGRSYLHQNSIHAVSLPELRMLAEKHLVNAYLGVLRGDRVIYLEALQSRGAIVIVSAPGSSGHLHSTAFGKALLAEMSEEDAARLLGEEPYPQLTKKTKVRLKPILKELADVRRLGYAISDEENLSNVLAAGAVIRDATGAPVAAISGAVPRNSIDEKGVASLGRLLLEAAQRISHRLGAPPSRIQQSSLKAGKVRA
jgi:DNA-binding IclR family transcriptional regulator